MLHRAVVSLTTSALLIIGLLVGAHLTSATNPAAADSAVVSRPGPTRVATTHIPLDDRDEVRRGHRVHDFYAGIILTNALAHWYMVGRGDANQHWYETHRPVVRLVVSRHSYNPRPPAYSNDAPMQGGTPCAIPAYICARESGGNIRAQNPVSSASGKYQFLDSTWGTHYENGVLVPGYGGYFHAKDAPETVQDERAQQVWAATGGHAWDCC